MIKKQEISWKTVVNVSLCEEEIAVFIFIRCFVSVYVFGDEEAKGGEQKKLFLTFCPILFVFLKLFLVTTRFEPKKTKIKEKNVFAFLIRPNSQYFFPRPKGGHCSRGL